MDDYFVFEDKANQLKAVIFFKEKKNDLFTGKIYKYSPEKKLWKKDPSKLSDVKDIEETICDITGSWLQGISFGGVEYWNIDKSNPMRPIPVPNPLHSDHRYREDLIWLRREN